jgi:archaellum component FlaC
MGFESFGAAILDNLFAKNRQEDAQAFSAQQYATRYQTQTEDMKKAGINPMLSVSSGAGSQPTSTAASPGSNFTQASLNKAQIENIRAQTELNSANAAKARVEAQVAERFGHPQAEANLSQTMAQAGLSSHQIGKVDQETRNVIAQIQNTKDENQRIHATIDYLKKQAAMLEQTTLTEPVKRNLLKEQASKVVLEAGLTALDLDAAEKLGNLGRETQQIKPLLDLLRGLTRK